VPSQQGGYPGIPAQPGGYPGAAQQAGSPGAAQQGGYPGAAQQGGYPGAPQQAGYPGAGQQGGYPGAGQQAGYPGAAQQGGYPGAAQQGGYAGAGQQPGAYPGAQPQYGYGQGQPGYPGGAAQYPNAPGYYSPTPPRKSRRGLIIGIVAAVVVLGGGGAALAALLGGGSVSPTTMALKSGQALASARGLGLNGNIGGESASLNVTRAGTVEGAYTQDGNQITRFTIGGVTYLKAPTAFWKTTAVGDQSAGQAGGNWAKAPASAVDMSFGSLTPGQVSHVLEHVGQHPQVVDTTLDGTKVIKLSAGGTTYYVASSSPYRLMRIDGVSGGKPYSFDVTALNSSTVGPIFTVLHADAQAVGSAVDPNAIILPVQKITFGSNCNAASSCTVSSKVTVTDPSSPKLLVKMTVDFSATKDGSAFATCDETTPATTLGTVAQSCGVGGTTWSHWFNSHKGNFNTWADAHFEAFVNSASDVSALQSELNQEQQGS